MTFHCPVCSNILEDYPLLDPWRTGLRCTCGHEFFTTSAEAPRGLVVPEAGHMPEPTRVPPLPEGSSDLDVLSYWLTDPPARRELAYPLALACLRFISILESGAEMDERRRDARALVETLTEQGRLVTLFRHCAICGGRLTRFDDPRELYMDGLRCAAGHESWHRGIDLLIKHGGDTWLAVFPADVWLARNLDLAVGRGPPSASAPDELWENRVHPQLRAVLIRLRPHLRR